MARNHFPSAAQKEWTAFLEEFAELARVRRMIQFGFSPHPPSAASKFAVYDLEPVTGRGRYHGDLLVIGGHHE